MLASSSRRASSRLQASLIMKYIHELDTSSGDTRQPFVDYLLHGNNIAVIRATPNVTSRRTGRNEIFLPDRAKSLTGWTSPASL